MLVAENNPVARALICSYLERLGVFPDAAAHGGECLDACRMHVYDLVFLECRMPVMDGFVAAREIRAGEAGKGKRAYIVGMAEVAEAGSAPVLPHGMDALVIKPLDFDTVCRHFRKACEDRGPGPVF